MDPVGVPSYRIACHGSLLLLALITPATATSPPAHRVCTRWAVFDFKNLRSGSGRYGRIVTAILQRTLSQVGESVLPDAVIRRATQKIGGEIAPGDSAYMRKLGALTFGPDAASGRLLKGELVDAWFERIGKRRRAKVLLRLVAYDAVAGCSIDGCIEKRESSVRDVSTSGDALIAEATTQAVTLVAQSLMPRTTPAASLLFSTSAEMLINRGRQDGYAAGARVFLTRGNLFVGMGRVGSVESGQSELIPESPTMPPRPGDRVRLVVPPPWLPSPERCP